MNGLGLNGMVGSHGVAPQQDPAIGGQAGHGAKERERLAMRGDLQQPRLCVKSGEPCEENFLQKTLRRLCSLKNMTAALASHKLRELRGALLILPMPVPQIC